MLLTARLSSAWKIGRPVTERAHHHVAHDRGDSAAHRPEVLPSASRSEPAVDAEPSCFMMQPSGCLSFISSQSAACQGAARPSRAAASVANPDADTAASNRHTRKSDNWAGGNDKRLAEPHT